MKNCSNRALLRKSVCPFALVLLSAASALAEEAPVMVLEGDVSAVHHKGVFTVFDPLYVPEGYGNLATPGPHTSEDGKLSGNLHPAAMAQAPIGPDGAFRLKIPADTPKVVYFAVIGAETSENSRPENTSNSNRFILEPGELKLRMIYRNYSVITGGRYNDAVYGSWRLSDEYRAAQEEYSWLRTPQADESEEDKALRFGRRMETEEKLETLEWEGAQNVLDTQDDTLTSRLASDSVMAFMPVQLAIVREMVKRAAELPVADEDAPGPNISMDWGPREIRLVKESEDNKP